ncbi:MAG: MBL fold metallo-hydrolase [Promethearchaeota archaeon]
MKNKIIVLYDNSIGKLKNSSDSTQNELIAGWGFSAAIFLYGKKILFDCGWSGSILLNNMLSLGVKPNDFDYIIISHQHWDHIGGLSLVVDKNPQAEIFLPSHFSNNLTNELKKYLKDVHKVSEKDGSYEIMKNLYVTGDTKGFGNVYEQGAGLILGENQILISGCMHPSFLPLYKILKRNINPNVLMGGVHGFKDPKLLIKSGITKAYIGHCTENMNVFLNEPKLNTKKIFVGFKVEE